MEGAHCLPILAQHEWATSGKRESGPQGDSPKKKKKKILEGSDTAAIWQSIEGTAPHTQTGETQHCLPTDTQCEGMDCVPCGRWACPPLISFPWRIDIIHKADHMNRWITCKWTITNVKSASLKKHICIHPDVSWTTELTFKLCFSSLKKERMKNKRAGK